MAKVVPQKPGRDTITVSTTSSKKTPTQAYKWWNANSQKELWQQTLDTVGFLKESQQYRYRQASIFSRLYGNMPLFNFIGSNINKANVGQQLPIDRPTMNVVQSCIDTLVSRISQSRPRPVFLTDNGDYKERNLAKQMNTFINGELYQTHAYEEGALILRDAAALETRPASRSLKRTISAWALTGSTTTQLPPLTLMTPYTANPGCLSSLSSLISQS